MFEVEDDLKEEALKKIERMKEQYSGLSVSFNYWFFQKIKSSFHLIINYKFFHVRTILMFYLARARSLTIRATRKKYDELNIARM